MNIETGEYVRTNKGNIFRFVYLENSQGVTYQDRVLLVENGKVTGRLYYFSNDEKIVKHSKNIMDLIEVGDIVKVLDISWIRVMDIDDKDFLEAFNEEVEEKNWKLLSIMTKEQFKSVEYNVEE